MTARPVKGRQLFQSIVYLNSVNSKARGVFANMPIVTWSDEYNVNVEKIDKQHRHLLQLVNDLHAAVEERIDKEELKSMLIGLTEFTGTHFALEEQLMSKHDYPNQKAHKKEHKMLLRHLGDLVTAVSNGKYPTFYSDYDVSTDWALVHIREHDMPLGIFLNKVE